MAAFPVRIQVHLSKEQHRLLKEKSRRSRESMANLIRKALDIYLERVEKDNHLPSDDPIFDIIGKGKSEVTDLSVNHDRYLYGLQKEE